MSSLSFGRPVPRDENRSPNAAIRQRSLGMGGMAPASGRPSVALPVILQESFHWLTCASDVALVIVAPGRKR